MLRLNVLDPTRREVMMRDPRRPHCALFGMAAILLGANAFAHPAEADSKPSTASAVISTAPSAGPAGTVDPRAARVLERYRAAIHAQEPLKSMHTKGAISAFGFTGTIETWIEQPDRSASVTLLGPFTLKSGNDGTLAWRTDPSGKLMVLDGRDPDRPRA